MTKIYLTKFIMTKIYHLQKIFLQYGARLLRKEFYSKENDETNRNEEDDTVKGNGSMHFSLKNIGKKFLFPYLIEV